MIKSTSLSAALLISISAISQITITSADMPNAGDNIRVSLANSVGTNNPATTGANSTWNYSTLTPTAQRQEIFASPTTFVTPYNLFFSLLNTSYGKDNYTITSLPLPTVQITAAYDFMKESTGDLRQIGAGYVVNAIPLPFLYTNPDIMYRFPLDYLDSDSCNFSFGLPIPTLGYYGQTAKRVNTVDGWGTLTTPYGTFQTLRVQSTIEATDTIYLTSLGFGSKIPRPLQYEYKWMATGQKIPVLQINGNYSGIAPNFVVTSVIYRDSLRNVPQVGVDELIAQNYNVQVYPNPAIDKAVVAYELAAETDVKISVFDVLGKEISYEKLNKQSAGMHFKELIVDSFSKGIYFVKIEINNTTVTKKLIVE